MPDHHPGWQILHTFVTALSIMMVLTVVLYVTASSFDATEIQAITAGGAVSTLAVTLINKVWRA